MKDSSYTETGLGYRFPSSFPTAEFRFCVAAAGPLCPCIHSPVEHFAPLLSLHTGSQPLKVKARWMGLRLCPFLAPPAASPSAITPLLFPLQLQCNGLLTVLGPHRLGAPSWSCTSLPLPIMFLYMVWVWLKVC